MALEVDSYQQSSIISLDCAKATWWRVENNHYLDQFWQMSLCRLIRQWVPFRIQKGKYVLNQLEKAVRGGSIHDGVVEDRLRNRKGYWCRYLDILWERAYVLSRKERWMDVAPPDSGESYYVMGRTIQGESKVLLSFWITFESLIG